MKTIHFYLFTTLFALAACKGGHEQRTATANDAGSAIEGSSAANPAVTHRYLIKSGCINYIGAMGVNQTLYFDNYGAVEAFTTEMDMGTAKTKITQIRKEGYQYSIVEGQPTGTKTKWITNDINYSQLDPELLKRYKLKDLGTETILGKKCRKYSLETGNTPATVWIWGNIMVKTFTKMGNSDMIIEATKIEEAPVDAAVFEIPSNITFTEQ
jgi:hypothetical protein